MNSVWNKVQFIEQVLLNALRWESKTLSLPFLLLVTSVITLAGCAVTSPVWSDAKVAGPQLASGGKTSVVQKCTFSVIQGFPTSGSGVSCAYAFSTGTGLIEYWKLFAQIDQALSLATPLHPFLKEFRKQYQPNEAHYIKYQKYKLFLVAVVPAVIVGVPISDKEWDSCQGAFYTGCSNVGSKETMDTLIHYGQLPPVRPGSFWFIPESGMESTPLPDEAQSASIAFRNSTITLVSDGNIWRIAPRLC